jgi:hypothetical protein
MREHDAVVELDRVEVAVRYRAQAFARTALLRRQHFVERRIVHELLHITERQRQARFTDDDRLDFGDLLVLHAQAHAVVRRIAVLFDGADPGAHPRGHVRRNHRIRRDTGHRGPQAFVAERQLHVVFREARVRRDAHTRDISLRERIHVTAHHVGEAFVVAIRRDHRAGLARKLGERRGGQCGDGQSAGESRPE